MGDHSEELSTATASSPQIAEDFHNTDEHQQKILEENGVLQWYDAIAQTYPDTPGLDFMNYGYADLDEHVNDDISHNPMKLYKQVVANVPLTGRNVLEVSCGRGFGAAGLVRTYTPASYVGVDICPHVIALCQKKHAAVPGLSFVEANATKDFPFPNESFDIIISVEATHAYGSPEAIGRFAHEAARVLKPNGYLLWCDLCNEDGSGGSINYLTAGNEFIVRDKVDITKNVLHALDLVSTSRSELIKRIIPPEQQEDFRTFAGIPGTNIYEGMSKGRTAYWRAALRKKTKTATEAPIS